MAVRFRVFMVSTSSERLFRDAPCARPVRRIVRDGGRDAAAARQAARGRRDRRMAGQRGVAPQDPAARLWAAGAPRAPL